MRLRLSVQTLAASAALAAALALSAPALAQDGHAPNLPPGHPAVVDAEGRVFQAAPMPDQRADQRPDMRPEWRSDRGPDAGYSPEYIRAREDWLAECRHNQEGDRHGNRHIGGTIIGGLIGSIFGNRIAGRNDRTIGTIAGAAVGAVAGNAIDRAGDRSRDRAVSGEARDYCEAYLARYTAGQGYPGYPGYSPQAYGYVVPMMMVPATAQTRKACTETVVTEEWVTVRRPIHRYIPPRRRVIYDKRVHITPMPDKRIRSN